MTRRLDDLMILLTYAVAYTLLKLCYPLVLSDDTLFRQSVLVWAEHQSAAVTLRWQRAGKSVSFGSVCVHSFRTPVVYHTLKCWDRPSVSLRKDQTYCCYTVLLKHWMEQHHADGEEVWFKEAKADSSVLTKPVPARADWVFNICFYFNETQSKSN